MMMASADDYREKAARCRRLAAAITAKDDPAIPALLEIALEWDAKAAKAATDKGPDDPLDDL
jgi:hypothetical protein